MISIEIESRIDGCTGELGLCLAALPIFDDDPSVSHDGMIIAHDLVEHIQDHSTLGSYHDEHKALGVALYGRASWGGVVTADGIGYDLESQYSRDPAQMEYRENQDGALARSDYREEIENVLASARTTIIKEKEYDGADFDAIHCDEWLQNAGNAMALGIEEAEKLYGSGFRCFELFNAIQEAVEPYCRSVDFPGQRYILRYSIEDCTAQCKEITDDE